jgi:hypothetical protein
MRRKLTDGDGVSAAPALLVPMASVLCRERLSSQSETPVVGKGRVVKTPPAIESLRLPGCSMTRRSR